MKDALIEALTWDDLANGRGNKRQVDAYRELEWRRCAKDAVYFIEKYAHLYNKEDGSIIRPDLWPVQRQLIREWQNHQSTIAVKARQLGITTFTAHYALWEVIFKDAAKWSLISSTEAKASGTPRRSHRRSRSCRAGRRTATPTTKAMTAGSPTTTGKVMAATTSS